MKKYFYTILFLFILVINSSAQNEEKKPVLKMSDGQLQSHPVKIFVADANITKEMKPTLELIGLKKTKYDSTGKVTHTKYIFDPKTVAVNQTVAYEVDGTQITYTGTIMLFDFKNLDIKFYESGLRVLPVLRWNPPQDSVNNGPAIAVGEKEIYIGNPEGGRFYAILFIIIFFAFLILIKGKANRTLDLIRISETDMSLSLTQMLLWTLAVGGMVMAYGLMYLSVPDIPDTLIWLMGLSITASAAGHYQNYFLNESESNLSVKVINRTAGKLKWFSGLSSLVCIKTGGVKRLSIAKAQQLFWTLATITLFVVKSSLEGKLWAVPEELVILMGLSQGSYLLRNQMEIKTQEKTKEEKAKEEKAKDENK
ncbi:MAG: hypothetical protein A2068_08070 [Ignavibacteria bacterium GWB2_35_6b]|nr:MAG: hypothetical protein A2068_08070 [Ignavibacteria bacterium GWB2_35_6b]